MNLPTLVAGSIRRPIATFAVALGSLVLCIGLAAGCGGKEKKQEDTGFVIETDAGASADATKNGDGGQMKKGDVKQKNEKRPTGAACKSSSQCKGGVCIATDDYPDGYCTKINCQKNGCVGEDAVCVEFQDGSTGCVDGCNMHQDCREGYSCQAPAGTETDVCLPGEPPPPESFERSKNVLSVQCNPQEKSPQAGGKTYVFEFSIEKSTDSFMMVPYVTEGTLRPVDLETPSRTIDLRDDYRHHNARLTDSYSPADVSDAGTFGKVAFDWPILVPYAPQFANYVEPGKYKLSVTADTTEPCLYVLGNDDGKTLDLNLYFVGASGLDADSGENDPDLQRAIKKVEEIYNKGRVDIGKVRYFDVPEKIIDKYQRLTDRDDAHRLTAYGRPPTSTLAGHLSVDVFLVSDIAFTRRGRQQNVLGISAGIPGAAGLHGHPRDGLVFQTQDLDYASEHVGHIMAHEIGHFIGLRHTTEVAHGTSQGDQYDRIIGTTDPIKDTPECSDIYDEYRDYARRGESFDCKDYENLMFPVAPPPSSKQDPVVSSGQGDVMRWNPVVTSR